MIPVLYEADRTTFDDNGLGGLPHALECTVTREGNTPGGCYLDARYPVDGLHFEDIREDRIILAAPAPERPPQPFRISRIQREGKTAQIYAPHVSNELTKVVSYGSFSVHSGAVAFNEFARVARETGQTVNFHFYTDMWSDAAKTVDFQSPTPMSSIILGESGSILDLFGGELDFDGWNIGLHTRIGRDTGLQIRTGANIRNVRAVTDDSTLVTAVLPYYKGTQNNQDVFVYGTLCRAATAGDFNNLHAVPLDVSEAFQDLGDGLLPTPADVTAEGQAFINSSASTQLRTTYEVDYIPTPPELSGITPAPARNLDMFDRAQLVLPEYGVQATAKVVKTVHNVLTDKYQTVTIGTIQRNAADTIAAMIQKTRTQQILWR